MRLKAFLLGTTFLLSFYFGLGFHSALAADTNAVPAPQTAKPAPSPDLDSHFKITKVYTWENGPKAVKEKNVALEFEKQYWTYGAVTEADEKAKEGHYYVISWKNSGPPADIVARFEYRQVKSKDIVRTLTLTYPAAKGGRRSEFQVIGDAYQMYGPVSSWKFSLLKADKVVAEEKSFIW